MRQIFFGVILLLGVSALSAQAQEVGRKQLQLMIRESISEEEFERMVDIQRRTGKSWSDIFDYTIEPEREERMKQNRSLRRYVTEDDRDRRRGPGDGDRPGAAQAVEEKPISVQEEPVRERRQRIYNKEGRRPVVEEEESFESIPATSVRRRVQALRAEEEAQKKAIREGKVRTSRLYRSSSRQLDEESEDDDGETDDPGERGFGADVLDKYESKVFGQREDRFKGFGSKKDHERKIFKSGTIDSTERKKRLFGGDEE